MRRLWLGLALLAALFALGLGALLAMEQTYLGLSRRAQLAEEAAMAGDWAAADLQILALTRHWQRSKDWAATAVSHGPLEEIQLLLEQLALHRHLEDRSGYALCCAALSSHLEALSRAHSINWQSFL